MKLLLDQNLPPRLKQLLLTDFPDSIHVSDVGLDSADDEVVWEYARDHGLTIASKDSDFQHLAAKLGPPPKVIWIRAGNMATKDLAAFVLSFLQDINHFGVDGPAGLLVLG